MKSCFLRVAIGLSVGQAHAQSVPLTVAQLPLRGITTQAMVPRGWKLEKQIQGDLNRDKVPDAALVLVQKPAQFFTDDPPRSRALVVLLKAGKAWHRAGFNNSLLLGTRDGGAFYGVTETPVDISIKRGVLLVDQEFGSREVTHTTHKFRYDARAKHFLLIGYELGGYDRLTNRIRTQSDNYLTGLQKISDVEGKCGGGTRKTQRVSRKLRTLESIRVEERYSG